MLELILITLSLHTPTNDYYRNENWGAGIEYTQDLTYGAYVYKNSLYKDSIMLSLSKQYERFGFGIAIANNYTTDNKVRDGLKAESNPLTIFNTDVTVMPEFTIKLHNNIRIKTSYPVAQALGGDDVFNLQFNFPLDFN